MQDSFAQCFVSAYNWCKIELETKRRGKAAMANIMDYLEWRGDLSFEADSFNEIDNLILSQLVYVEFAGIVPGIKEAGSITLKAASELF